MSRAEPQTKKSKMASSLEQLKQLTTIVADTGDFEGRYNVFLYIDSTTIGIRRPLFFIVPTGDRDDRAECEGDRRVR